MKHGIGRRQQAKHEYDRHIAPIAPCQDFPADHGREGGKERKIGRGGEDGSGPGRTNHRNPA